MDAVCLSSASILRCFPFRILEKEVLVIPTGLEALFALWLLIANRGKGRKHLLVVAESWTYTLLVILDVITLAIPAVREHVSLFRIIDVLIAATCVVPITCYIIFLYLFSARETIPILPRRFQTLSALVLLFFMPLIAVSNELGSFLGITRGVGPDSQGKETLVIGFRDDRDHLLWTFFTSLNLALFTCYQAIVWTQSFYRLILALIDQRRIEDENRDERHFFRGTGWISAGIKVGVVETAVGFANASFGLALLRRILRFVSRALIIIGLTRGMDQLEDFQQVQAEMLRGRQTNRRSTIRNLISNPRISTFLQLSPNPARRMSQVDARMNASTQSIANLATKRGNPQDRVTVHFAPDNTPSLRMRFSVLEIPSPRELVASLRVQTDLESGTWRKSLNGNTTTSEYQSSYYPYSSPRSGHPALSVPQDFPQQPAPSTGRAVSMASDLSGKALGELTRQFPPLPTRVSLSGHSAVKEHLREIAQQQGMDITAARTTRVQDTAYPDEAFDSSFRDHSHSRDSSDRSDPKSEWLSQSIPHSPTSTIDYPSPLLPSASFHYPTPDSPSSMEIKMPADLRARIEAQHHRSREWGEDLDDYPFEDADDVSEGEWEESMRRRRSGRMRTSSNVTDSGYWLARKMTPISEDAGSAGGGSRRVLGRGGSPDGSEGPDSSQPPYSGPLSSLRSQASSQRSSQPSIGSVSRRRTPLPVRSGVIRGSVRIEPIVIPPRNDALFNNTRAVNGSESASSTGSGRFSPAMVVRDSEVLGTKNTGAYVTRRIRDLALDSPDDDDDEFEVDPERIVAIAR
jgi:hypothetical protein